MRTRAQERRQQYRDRSGRYDQVNPCYRCGHSAGEDYYSDRRTDTLVTLADGTEFHVADAALCLCQACAQHMDHLTDAEFVAELTDPNYGHLK